MRDDALRFLRRVLFLSVIVPGAGLSAAPPPPSWSPLGPPGGSLDAIVADPVQGGILYAGAEEGGVYRSPNGGRNWFLASTGLTDPTVNVLAIDPADPSILYVGTNGGFPGDGAGIWKSTDRAGHWAPSNTGLPADRAVRGIAIDPSNPARLLVALARKGIWESLDHGATWTNRSSGLTTLFMDSVAIDPRDSSIAWAGQYGSVFKTTNGGASWTEADSGLPLTSMDVLLPDPSQSGRVVAGIGQGIFVTTDGGASWTASSAGMPSLPEIFSVVRASDGAYYATDYNSGVYRSTDSGAHWVPVNTGLSLAFGYWALAPDPTDPATVYMAADSNGGGLFKTTDSGAHWNRSDDGISAHWVNAVAVDPTRDTTLYAGTAFGGVYRSPDGGITWQASDRPDLRVQALLGERDAPQVLFAADPREGGLFRSEDGGATWQQESQGATGRFQALAEAPGGTLYAGGSQGVFVTTDHGAHWNPSSTGLTGGNVRALAVDPENGSVLYAGNVSGVFKSVNGGHIWFPSSVGLPADDEVEAIVVDPANPTHVFAGLASGEVFASIDEGAHWSPRNGGLSSPGAVTAIVIDPAAAGRLWIATFGAGVFRSDDAGAHWSPVSAGLTPREVNALVLDPRRRVLYAGVAGGSVGALSLAGPRAVVPASPAGPARVEPPR